MVPFLLFIIRVNVYMFVVIMFLVNNSSFLGIADASNVLFIQSWTTHKHGLETEFLVVISKSKNIFDFTNEVKQHSYKNAINMRFCLHLYHINSYPPVYFVIMTW